MSKDKDKNEGQEFAVERILDGLTEVQEHRRHEAHARDEERRKREGGTRSEKRAVLAARRKSKMRAHTHAAANCGNPGCGRCYPLLMLGRGAR